MLPVQLVGGQDPAGGHVDHAETDVTGRCCDRGDRRVEGVWHASGNWSASTAVRRRLRTQDQQRDDAVVAGVRD